MKTRFFVIIILLINFVSVNSQVINCFPVTINYPKDITGISLFPVDYGVGVQRYFLCNTDNSSKYYVFDSENITFEVALIKPGFQYIGFKGNILIGYNKLNDSILFVDYSTQRAVQSNMFPNEYLEILKYIGREGLSTTNTRLSINQNGVLAYVDQGESVVTLLSYDSDTLSRLDIPIHFDHGLFQWTDANNLLIANANVIDDCGTMIFNTQSYHYDTQTITPLKNEPSAFAESIFYYSDKGYIFKMGNKLMFGEDFSSPITTVALPYDIQYVYEVTMLSKNRILLTAEFNKPGCHPFLIFEIDQY